VSFNLRKVQRTRRRYLDTIRDWVSQTAAGLVRRACRKKRYPGL